MKDLRLKGLKDKPFTTIHGKLYTPIVCTARLD